MDDYREADGDSRHDLEPRRRRSPQASLRLGVVFTVAFGLAWYFTRGWFFVFPLIFAGIVPMLEGLRRLAGSRDQPQLPSKSGQVSSEKQILLVAKEEKGVVTPALVALKTELSIQEAEQALEAMARQGYAQMRVTDSGRIEYEFPEFMAHQDGEEGRL